jgi:DNA-binding SARP family transcriptional activator
MLKRQLKYAGVIMRQAARTTLAATGAELPRSCAPSETGPCASQAVRFAILGPIGVSIDGRDAPLDGSKQRTVLAALLLAKGALVSDDRLSSLLWGWQPPNTISAQIYTYISRLRKYLGPAIEITRQRPGYHMRVGAAHFDYDEFQRLSRDGQDGLRTGQFGRAAERFRRALALWRGPALADVTEHLADIELPHLNEARLVALEGRIEADLALGRHLQLAPELTALVAEHPLREAPRAQLMTTLFRCDRQADALSVYLEGRRLLADELGVDPGATLERAYQSILAGDPGHGPALRTEREQVSVAAAGGWAGTWPEMLPPSLADLSGRDTELRQVLRAVRPDLAALSEARLDTPAPVLITGMAGVGKTTLAVRAAHLCREDFPDGQLYVDLDGMGPHPKSPFDVLGWFLRALGVPDAAIPGTLDERIQLYRSQLSRQRVLIVLDDAASDQQVRPLLPGGTRCRVMVTSRTHTATVAGAQVVSLHPLDTAKALELLGGIIGPDRVEREVLSAARIVELCGGLPLAVGIAGVRLAAKPQWPLERLAAGLAEHSRRLDELQRGDLNVRTSLQLSYEQLSEAVRTMFRQIALLDVPDFPAWAAADILGYPEQAAETLLEALVDARMLEISGIDNRGRPRYRYHCLVQLFAREQAGREDGRDQRRAVVEAALDAYRRRAGEAVKLLDLEPSAQASTETAVAWMSSERAALFGLFHQASATGRHASARDLSRLLDSFAGRTPPHRRT